MSDIQVEVPYMCPEDRCTKAFGHELDESDAEHGDGMYKTLVRLEGVYVKQWAPGKYSLKPYVQIKLNEGQAQLLTDGGWNVRYAAGPDHLVFGEPCWWLNANGRVAHTYEVFGPVNVVLRGVDWTWEDKHGRKAYLVDVTNRLMRQED